MNDDEKLRRVAYHQAGTVAAYFFLGHDDISYVCTVGDPGIKGHVEAPPLPFVDLAILKDALAADPSNGRYLAQARIFALLCGPGAEARYTGKADWFSITDPDLRFVQWQIQSVAQVVSSESLEQIGLIKEASQYVERVLSEREIWAGVEGVADELIKKRRIVGERAIQIMREHWTGVYPPWRTTGRGWTDDETE